MSSLIEHIQNSFINAENENSKITNDILNIEGFSGSKTKHFYNNLLRLNDARYLEIGTWKGSTVCAAMYGNKANIVCIDNWSEFGNFYQELEIKINEYKGENTVAIIEQDSWTVNVSLLPKFNIYMYDGNHSEECHYRALPYYYNCLDDTFIFIVDDWNWSRVRRGTKNAIQNLNLKVLYEKEIITTFDDSAANDKNGWWNGIYISVLQKQ
jgi:hypothetical protein